MGGVITGEVILHEDVIEKNSATNSEVQMPVEDSAANAEAATSGDSEPKADLPEDGSGAPDKIVPAEEPVPAEPAAEEPVSPSDITEPAPADDAAPAEATEAVPADEPAPAEPSPFDEPAPAEPTEPAPVEPTPFDEPAPTEPAPVEPSPFDEPAPTEPTPFDEPAPAEPSLFDEPAAEPAPAEEAPAADPFDFGTPDEPAAEAPATDADPFGAATEPTEPAAPAQDAFDIFGDTLDSPAAEPSAPAGDGLDDILGDIPGAEEPAAEPAEAPAADPFDGLLNPTSTQEGNQDEEQKRKSVFDELFGALQQVPTWYASAVEEAQCQMIAAQHDAAAKAVVSVAANKSVVSLDTTEMRTWNDNSGTFSVEGRLILITETYVRLLKTNGRTCTVPFDRLSQADAEYVAKIAEAISTQDALIAMAK